MRIAQIAPSYYPYLGGIEKFVQNISEVMVAKGHHVEVFTVDGKKGVIDKGILNGVVINRFPRCPFGLSKMLFDYLSKNGNTFDIIHAHSFHTLIPALSIIARRKANNKFNIVLMSHYHGKGKSIVSTLLLKSGRFLFSYFYRQADLIICHTEFEKELLFSHFNIMSDKIREIPSGASVYEIKEAIPFCATNKVICIVSRLEKYKNIHVAIRVMPYLPNEYNLVIIGDGTYRKNLEKLVDKLKLRNRVFIKGNLPNNEVYRWYKSCVLVLNLSNLEAFGITVIEGLASNCPVIVNKRTALAELSRRFKSVYSVEAWKTSEYNLANFFLNCIKSGFVEPNLNEYTWTEISDKILNCYYMINIS